MANENNLIRPPVLGNQNIPPPPVQPAPANIQASPDLTGLIRDIVSQIIRTDGQELINNIVHPRPVVTCDQTIDERHRNNLSEMDKIPDVVRSLREFTGKKEEYSSWKKSVERVLSIYNTQRGTPKYFGILNVIRNKIVGQADSALESYNTPLDWSAISRCLTTHYADKRDLGTLEYQMTGLIQGRQTVQEYYAKVYSHLSLILNSISGMEMSSESMRVLTDTYREKALDTFIRGLSGDLPRLLGIKGPQDLPEALYLCQKLENQSFRAQHANHQQYQSCYPNMRPPVPPRQPQRMQTYPRQFTNQQTRTQHQNFQPELAYLPRPNPPMFSQQYNPPIFNQFQNQVEPPPRPFAPKPLPKPDPMDVDMSIRTARVNYANRPNFRYAGKRNPSQTQFTSSPQKVQRNFHIDTHADSGTTDFIEHQQFDESNSQTLCEEVEQSYPVEAADFTDIHFLE